MARAKSVKRPDFIGLLEQQILDALKPKEGDAALTMAERISLINAGTRLATARHKISGNDDEGSFYS